jgi:hypothetical protein
LLTGMNGTCASPGVSLSYDPFLRLTQVAGSKDTTLFAYDGLAIIADYNQNDALQHRYVFGPGIDEPSVEYSGTYFGDGLLNWVCNRICVRVGGN